MELGDAHAPLGGLDVPEAWLEQLDERRGKTSRPAVADHREDTP
jgi:hypothetical protein